ncbi:MAG: 3-isopropylmalate dehydratase small subunit [Archaeoglobaceae archaeon]|nr:3-isopropylmalate dehydratase small subunit [Archaeoglobales archaeon]MDI9642133.1 3-isopropylmalate dehydratase small subunit [Archaeoglobales archaeon]
MRLRGRAWKFGDDISTDHITPGRYYHLRSNMTELAKHVMEDADPDFMKKFKPGDFIVAGKNFGMGSSREHAPLALKIAGVNAVIAKSFARIFYRNAINIGLPLLIAQTEEIENGEEIEVEVSKGIIYTKKGEIGAKSLPEIMIKILNEGGLVNYIKKHGDIEV